MHKLFTEESISIQNQDDFNQLKTTHTQKQVVVFECSSCKKSVTKPLKRIKYLLCRNCSTKKTNLEKYGVEFFTQTKDYKERLEQTSLKKYGTTHPSKSDIVKEKKIKTLEKHYGTHYFKTEEFKKKAVEKHLENYGVENVSQSDTIKKKKIETSLKHFGVPFPNQSPSIREKTRKTNIEKYGETHYFQSDDFKEKSKTTSSTKYGFESPNSSPEVKEKQKLSNLEKYGFEKAIMNPIIKEKTKQSNLLKYQVDNFCKSKEYKLRQKDILAKRDKTCLEKYGVTNYAQTKECRQKASKKYFYGGLSFDSSWELAYYLWLKSSGVAFEYQCDPIEYFDEDGTKHFYTPDFKIGDKLIEIKGPQFFTEDGKFVNPFDRSGEADSHNQSKYNCMIQNNVVIISDISEQLKFVEEKFGKDFLKKLKCH